MNEPREEAALKKENIAAKKYKNRAIKRSNKDFSKMLRDNRFATANILCVCYAERHAEKKGLEHFQKCLVGFQEAKESYALHITFLQYVPYSKPPTAPDEASSSSCHSNNDKPKKGIGSTNIRDFHDRKHDSMQACITLPNHFAFFFPFTHNLLHD